MTLHAFNTLLRSFMTSKLDESKALRVLRHRIDDDFSIEAIREVLFERSQQHLTVDVRIEITNVDLCLTSGSATSSSSHGSTTLSSMATSLIEVSSHHSVRVLGESSSHIGSLRVVAILHFRSVHVMATASWTTTHAVLAVHWSTTLMILLVPTCTMRCPVQFVIALCSCDWLAIQVLEN